MKASAGCLQLWLETGDWPPLYPPGRFEFAYDLFIADHVMTVAGNFGALNRGSDAVQTGQSYIKIVMAKP
jgi:hypothetical protein